MFRYVNLESCRRSRSDICLSQVIVTADLTKSPPVIKVYSVNPYAQEGKRHVA